MWRSARPQRGAELQRWLRELAPQLDALRELPPPPPVLLRETLEAARQELARSPEHSPVSPRNRLPAGFPRELARLAAAATPPLLIALAWNAWVVLRGSQLLGAILPEPAAHALPLAYAVGALGWLALAVGSLPLAAHRRARAALARRREPA